MGMRIAIFLVASIVLQQPSGCNDPKPDKSAEAPKPALAKPPTHRFENVTNPPSPGLALDTTTGQYCRTWPWVYANKPNANDLNTLPTCLSLYDQTPSEDTDPFKQFGGTANPK